MKKYKSRNANGFGIAAIGCAVILIAGIFMLIFGYPDSTASFALVFIGSLMGIMFFAIFLSEKSRVLIIDTDKVIFPRGVRKNDKIISKKTVVKFDEMNSLECEFYKGDGFIAGDTYFYTLKLKGSAKIVMTLYAFGKDAENEIYETIRQRISESKSERRRNKKRKSQPK